MEDSLLDLLVEVDGEAEDRAGESELESVSLSLGRKGM